MRNTIQPPMLLEDDATYEDRELAGSSVALLGKDHARGQLVHTDGAIYFLQ